MKQNEYCFEGKNLRSDRNSRYYSSEEALRVAMEDGVILEGVGFLCDSDGSLRVKMGDFCGIIPDGECVFTHDGTRPKEIAVISRVGKPCCFVITDIQRDASGTPVPILSRRLAQMKCSQHKIASLSAGDVIEAKITRLDPFGAFCDVGCGIISLLPIDCMSVSRISHPSDRFKNGQIIKAVVKSSDSCGRLTLSHRELLGTWEENAMQFSPGQTAAGIIRSVEDYGIFVELTPNLAGLAEYRDDVFEGQSAAVYIKNIIPERMKVKLAIIDASDTEVRLREYDYPDVSHIDRWRYSPANCDKVIESVFDLREINT